MPQFSDPRLSWRRRADAGSDAGFTLIEVLVAFLIIAIIATAGTSLTIRGMRATMDAKHLTHAKNLVNLQVEQMRGLPYFVSRATSGPDTGPTARKVDVLDKYFPNVAAPGGSPNCSADASTWLVNKAAWRGYVAAGSTARCPFEPLTGPFYRTIVDPALVTGSVPTAVVVSTQFLDVAGGGGSAAPPVIPPGDYSADDPSRLGKDSKPADQVAAHVTAVWGTASTAKRTTSRTDIADRRGGPPLVTAETNAAAVVIEGKLANGERRRLELGTVSGEGGVTVVTTAAVEAVGASMQTDSGREDGAAQVANAPGTVSGSAGPADPDASLDGRLSIGLTSTTGVSATNAASNPGYSAVGSAEGGSFTLDQNRKDRPGLKLGPLWNSLPLVKVVNGNISSTGGCPALSDYSAFGSGFMNTGTGTPTTLDACARTGVQTVQLFPMPSVPGGLIQVEADNIVARAEINGNTPTAATAGTLRVRWFEAGAYTAWTTIDYTGWATSSASGETFTGALPSLTAPTIVQRYISSWAAFSGAKPDPQPLDTATNARSAAAKIPAALTLTTVPLRVLSDGTLDPDSAVKITIGRAMASATDRR